MQLEDYFEFLEPDDIRLKGTRIGIETVLEDYFEGASPEEIAARYRGLSLEQVYVTITYYLCNKEKIERYLESWRVYTDQAAQAQDYNPSAVITRLRRLRANASQPVRN